MCVGVRCKTFSQVSSVVLLYSEFNSKLTWDFYFLYLAVLLARGRGSTSTCCRLVLEEGGRRTRGGGVWGHGHG